MSTRPLAVHRLALFLTVSALPAVLAAADLSYDLQLNTPKLQSLTTSLAPTGGVVSVQIQVQYTEKGTLSCTGAVDSAAVTCQGTIKGTNYSYLFKVRAATVPPTTLSISGTLGSDTAVCSYSGPKGRTNVVANPVSFDIMQPVPAAVDLSPVINTKNLVTGSGRIRTGYTADLPLAGPLKGKVTSNSVALLLKQGKRMAVFNGVRDGNVYRGPLKLSSPPAKETITNFTIPVIDIPLTSGTVIFRGALTIISNQLPAPATGASITVRSDANGDGKFLGKEIIRTTANTQGIYEVKASLIRGRAVLLEIRKPGFAEVLQSFPSVTPGAVLVRNALLQPLEVLDVTGGTAESSDGSIQLDGLPSQVKFVQARLFDPTTESSRFPGQFADDQGKLLISSVFATIEATDSTGRSVTNLGANVTLFMEVPENTWPTLADLTPGNGQIDVPLYYFDKDSGQWKRNATDGWLADSSHFKIAEDQLASIHNGSFAGDVFAAGSVSHLSWWNIDWPVDSHACISGVLMGTNGLPVPGASISVVGLTYNGLSGPKTTAEDGAFCFDIMRSEAEVEDVDLDGVNNETHQVQLRVQSGANHYAFGPISSPQTAGTCSNGGCLDVGALTLDQSSLLSSSCCTVTGRVVWSGVSIRGTPGFVPPGGGVPFATVAGFDPDAPSSDDCTNIITTANNQGYFSLRVPVMSGLSLVTYARFHSLTNGFGFFAGALTTVGCPGSPVTVPADYTLWGPYVVILTKNSGDLLGNATINIQGNIVVIVYPNYPDLSTYYVGSLPSVGPPFQPGLWLIVNLRNNSPGTYVGTMTFTANSLFPASGTWTISGGTVNLSGRWSQDLP